MRERFEDFMTTRWSVLAAVQGPRTAAARVALEELCRAYWGPLYTWTRRRGLDAEEAADATQAFFTALLSGDDLAQVRPEAGRFRAWLLACMKHFLSKRWEAERAQKRGGGAAHVALDVETAEATYLAANTDRPADELYDRHWALLILGRVRNELAEEYEGRDKLALYRALEPALAEGLSRSHAELGAELGMKPEAVKTAVHRLRRRYLDLVRRHVLETVSAPTELQPELEALLKALA